MACCIRDYGRDTWDLKKSYISRPKRWQIPVSLRWKHSRQLGLAFTGRVAFCLLFDRRRLLELCVGPRDRPVALCDRRKRRRQRVHVYVYCWAEPVVTVVALILFSPHFFFFNLPQELSPFSITVALFQHFFSRLQSLWHSGSWQRGMDMYMICVAQILK